MGLWPVLLAVALSPASAQVTVELTLEQEQYLPAESLPVTVRITNRTGQSLRLGQAEDWLTFSVEARDNQIVPKIRDVPVVGEFVLESSQVVTLRVDVSPYFLLTRPGRYLITATMPLKEWNQDVRSAPKSFDIIPGVKLWEQEIGLPESVPGTNATPEMRKFVLQQANYLKTQVRLYVRLTDASGSKTLRVFPVGPIVSFGRPEPQVDKFSNLHLLFQSGPHSCSYLVINPDGEIIARRTYDSADKRPHLTPDAEGKVLVTGGARRPAASDIPPSKAEAAAADKPKPKPAPGEMMFPEP